MIWKGGISVTRRLALGFGAVLSLVLLLIATYFYAQQQAQSSFEELTRLVIPRKDAAHEIEEAFLRQAVAARTYIIFGDERFLDQYRQSVIQGQVVITRLEQLPRTPEGADFFAEIKVLQSQYTQTSDKGVALRQQGDILAAQNVAEHEMTLAREQLLGKARQFIAIQSRLTSEATANFEQAQDNATTSTTVLGLLIVLFSAVAAYFTALSITRPVSVLRRASRSIAAGDYKPAIRLAPTTEKIEEAQNADDELRALTATVGSMAEALLDRENRLTAQARLSAVLASSIDVEQVAKNALRQIAEHTGCEIGVVYVRDADGKILRPVAAYSLDGTLETARIGEGIPGEAAASRRCVIVREIPPDTPFRVDVGFDQAPPRMVIAVPMICQDQLVGVALLGSLHALTDDILRFIETSAQQLGLSLQNALAHQKAEKLAEDLAERNELLAVQNEELQMQAEEIQSQNEEIQAQAEEIQAQNDELSIQNAEIEKQRNEVFERNAELAALRSKAEKESERLQAIIESIPEGVIICDGDGRVTTTNRTAVDLCQRPIPFGEAVDALAEKLRLFAPGSDGVSLPASDLPFVRSARQGVTLRGQELIVKWPNGEERTLLCNTAPLSDAGGSPIGAVGVIQDISAIKEVDRLKDEFLSVAAHELKSPLTSLKGFAQILQHRMSSVHGFEAIEMPLRTIDNQVDKLVWLVNRLLHTSRARMGHLQIERVRVDLVDLVRTQIDQTQVKSNQHEVVLDEDGEVLGYWDPGYLEQVIVNLLDNAIRYSPEGGQIRVTVRRENGSARLTVADQGIGISNEGLQGLFKRYYRSDDAKLVSAEGMGIGLYVSNAIVQAHGGRIWAESEQGKGSTFHVELPTSPSDETYVDGERFVC